MKIIRNAVIGVGLACIFASAAFSQTSVVREGTEVPVRFTQKLTSATAQVGDRFNIETGDAVKLENGAVIPAGTPGVGEVVSAKKRGFMGQAGELNVRLNYIRVGDTRVKLRASKGAEGKGAMGSTVALTVLFGPLGLLKRGHDIEINEGQEIIAYVDQDAEVALAPPQPAEAPAQTPAQGN